MTTLDHFSSTSHPATRQSIVVRLAAAVQNAFRSLKNRREFYRLGELSDAELADIGLTRADLHVVVGLPLASDPTVALNALARRRIESPERAARFIC